MFEKSINYFEIKGKLIEIIHNSNVPYLSNKIIGICLNNPRLIKYSLYDSLNDNIGIWVKKKHSTCIFSYNKLKNNDHTMYIPQRIIKKINVFKNDYKSRIMLLWIIKYKNIPLDITKYILEFIKDWKIKVPVTEFNL